MSDCETCGRTSGVILANHVANQMWLKPIKL